MQGSCGGDVSEDSVVRHIPVGLIRPEDGLARQRDRAGHDELRRSVERFGVLTPITVRAADDGSGEYLLVKGQGRTLACRLLGHATVPAIIVGSEARYEDKVQQFLVENVARLRMRPAERALLINNARQQGEETSTIAKRFGLSAATVRRLLAQLENADNNELAALRSGQVSLALQGIVHSRIASEDRSAVIDILLAHTVSPSEFDSLLNAFGWDSLYDLGREHQSSRLALLGWACATLRQSSARTIIEKMRDLASSFPSDLSVVGSSVKVVI